LPVICMILLVACKEKGPFINYTNENYSDTSYVGPVPAAQSHNVLIEDFTGVTCTNCPQGHDYINAIIAQYPNRINVLSIYPNDFGQANPTLITTEDIRTAYGTQIGQTIYGALQFMPMAGIDRVQYASNLQLDRSVWSTATSTRLSSATPVNLSVTSSYDSVSGKAVIQATVVFTQTVTTQQNLSMAIVEDSIIGPQEDIKAQTGIDTFYAFTNVFRDFVTINNAPYGDAFLAGQASIPAGTVYIKKITYTLPAMSTTAKGLQLNAIKAAHCKVVAFVNYTNSAGSKDVLQSATCKFAP
jgi:hypothetical protein